MLGRRCRVPRIGGSLSMMLRIEMKIFRTQLIFAETSM